MKIKDILKVKGPEVITISEEKTLDRAIEVMVQNSIGALLVLDQEGKIKGIITERDIMIACNKMLDRIRETKISELTTKPLLIGNPDDTLEYAEAVMTENRIRHLPIIDGDRLVGLVSIGDIVKSISKQRKIENHYLKDYIFGKYPA